MAIPAVNSLGASEVRIESIRRQRQSCSQTLSRLDRILQKVERAAKRGNEKASRTLAELDDCLYERYASLVLEEDEWEV